VLNKICIEPPLPFQLGSNCILDKATAEQQEKIKRQFSKLCGWLEFSPSRYYEYDSVGETVVEELPAIRGRRTSRTLNSKSLQESDWRYYVVSSAKLQPSVDIEYASNLSDLPLNLTLRFHKSGGVDYQMASLQKHFEETEMDPTTYVSADLLNDVSQTYKTLIEVAGKYDENSEFPEIRRALTMYDYLLKMTPSHVFRILGLFAIIEMLITHNPKLEDKGDSITHQMRSKIPLLSRRFDKSIEIEKYF
jgi:hypothetical protein